MLGRVLDHSTLLARSPTLAIDFANGAYNNPRHVAPELQRPAVMQAIQEVKMFTQSELERERYDSRIKAQRDQNAYLLDALERGMREEKMKTIHFCERFLKKPQTPMEQLAPLSLEALARRRIGSRSG